MQDHCSVSSFRGGLFSILPAALSLVPTVMPKTLEVLSTFWTHELDYFS
jgi:hypothetical protein